MTLHPCPKCSQPMDVYTQTYPAKYNKPDRQYATCFNPACVLLNITLAKGEHERLTDEQIACYQEGQK